MEESFLRDPPQWLTAMLPLLQFSPHPYPLGKLVLVSSYLLFPNTAVAVIPFKIRVLQCLGLFAPKNLLALKSPFILRVHFANQDPKV